MTVKPYDYVEIEKKFYQPVLATQVEGWDDTYYINIYNAQPYYGAPHARHITDVSAVVDEDVNNYYPFVATRRQQSEFVGVITYTTIMDLSQYGVTFDYDYKISHCVSPADIYDEDVYTAPQRYDIFLNTSIGNSARELLGSILQGYNTSIVEMGYTNKFALNIPLVVVNEDVALNNPILMQLLNMYATTGNTDALDTIEVQGLGEIINRTTEPPEDNRGKYYIYNKYADGVATFNGINFPSNATIYERYEDIITDGRCCLHKYDKMALRIKSKGVVAGSDFSDISRDNMTAYTGQIFYTEPFYTKWDGVTLGNIRASINYLITNMYIFTNLEYVNRYLDGDDSVVKYAVNYDDIANKGESFFVNNTGNDETATTFGMSYHTNIFAQKYVLSKTILQEIAGKLYDSEGFWGDIKKGLELWGNNLADALVDLSYYPLNMTEVLQTSGQQYVYFGSYKLDLSAQVQKVIYENGYKDIGSIVIEPTFNNWRDYEPYQKLYVYLPYVGLYPLSLKRYLGKSVTVRYYIDTNTRGCIACLIADGRLLDYYNGQIGVQQPITATNFGEYANAQINTLLKGGSSMVSNAGAGIMAGIGGGGVGAVASAGISAGLGIASEMIHTEYDLTANNLRDFDKTVGGSSGILNEFLPQYVYFIFEIMNMRETDNLLSLNGKPSNASGRIADFGGYLKCDSVNLVCDGATSNERNEILALLKSGIYI